MKIYEDTTVIIKGISPALAFTVADPSKVAVLETEPRGQHVCTAAYEVHAFADGTLRVVAVDRDGQICQHDRAIVRVRLIDGTAPTPTESPGPIARLCGGCSAVGFKTPALEGKDCCLGCYNASKRAIDQRSAQNGGPSTGLGAFPRPPHPVEVAIAARLAQRL